jgi:hypothetical protein
MGGGTYTGIEAVSTFHHAGARGDRQRTIVYMGVSLASRRRGAALLPARQPVSGRLNAVLVERIGGIPGAGVFIVLTLFAEAALLVVAAGGSRRSPCSWRWTAGFRILRRTLGPSHGAQWHSADGSRALAALPTRGNVRHLVVMLASTSSSPSPLDVVHATGESGRTESGRRLVLFGQGSSCASRSCW